MSIDASPLGQLAAKVMDDLHEDVTNGEMPENARIVAALIVVEIQHEDAGGSSYSTITARASDDRNIIGLGLAQRATQAMLYPD